MERLVPRYDTCRPHVLQDTDVRERSSLRNRTAGGPPTGGASQHWLDRCSHATEKTVTPPFAASSCRSSQIHDFDVANWRTGTYLHEGHGGLFCRTHRIGARRQRGRWHQPFPDRGDRRKRPARQQSRQPPVLPTSSATTPPPLAPTPERGASMLTTARVPTGAARGESDRGPIGMTRHRKKRSFPRVSPRPLSQRCPAGKPTPTAYQAPSQRPGRRRAGSSRR